MGEFTRMIEQSRERGWEQLEAVGIRTTDEGPFIEDLFWQLWFEHDVLEIPGGPRDDEDWAALSTHLPGLDWLKITRASGCTEVNVFRVWHRVDSVAKQSPERLRARFEELVARMGGVFVLESYAALLAAWTSPTRHYHDVEHLDECLRELDATPDLARAQRDRAELALWYHDAIYEPRASNSERRSAEWLERDGRLFGLDASAVQEVAALVRSTAHGDPTEERSCSVAEDVVHDVDLAILGRHPLRFWEYEHGVEAEFGWLSRHLFFPKRRRFLERLLAQPNLYRCDYFRERYEAAARKNLNDLLASPRYRVPIWQRLAQRLFGASKV